MQLHHDFTSDMGANFGSHFTPESLLTGTPVLIIRSIETSLLMSSTHVAQKAAESYAEGNKSISLRGLLF